MPKVGVGRVSETYIMKLDFSIDQTSSGILNPEDLRFFYYDVGLETMTNAPVLYCWDEKIQSYVDSMQMEVKCIEETERHTLDNKFEKDKMFFLKKENETKEESFFRHLRNAFAHYRINRNGDYIFCKDIDPKDNSITMVGYIKGDSLKELCFRFIDQRVS